MEPEDSSQKNPAGGVGPEDSPPMDPAADSGEEEALSMEEINSLLAKEDPRFLKDLEDIQELKPPEGLKIAPLEIEEEADGETELVPTSWHARLLRALSQPQVLVRLFIDVLQAIVRASIQRKNKIKTYFKELSPAARRSLWFMFLCFAALSGALASFGKYDLRSLIGSVEIRDLREVAAETFYFDESAPRESFFSPMRRPDAYILLKSMVVQLRPTSRHPQSKLFIEFIIDTSSQRAALEVQNLENTFRDKLARAIEGFSYEELSTIRGKERLKESLKSHLNASMSVGYARDIFFQKFLLQ